MQACTVAPRPYLSPHDSAVCSIAMDTALFVSLHLTVMQLEYNKVHATEL